MTTPSPTSFSNTIPPLHPINMTGTTATSRTPSLHPKRQRTSESSDEDASESRKPMTTQNHIVALEHEIEQLKGATKNAHAAYKDIVKENVKLEQERDEYKRLYEALRGEAVGATDTNTDNKDIARAHVDKDIKVPRYSDFCRREAQDKPCRRSVCYHVYKDQVEQFGAIISTLPKNMREEKWLVSGEWRA
jgi:hypothetical protein